MAEVKDVENGNNNNNENLPKPNLIQTWCCMPDAERKQYACPAKHCGICSCSTHWGKCCWLYLFSFFSFLFFILSGYTAGGGFHNVPVHSPGIHDGRYWKESELQPQIVSAGSVIFWSQIMPLIILGLATIGALNRDIRANPGQGGVNVPFRGWALGVFYTTTSWSGFVVYFLKYYTSELRPLSIAHCGMILAEHVNGFNKTRDYTASLEQLKTCASHDGWEFFRGFPSGHSSAGFGSVFGVGLMLYQVEWILDGLIHAISCCSKNDVYLKIPPIAKATLRTSILVVTALGASFMAASRIMDGSHFPVQVTAGAIIGASAAAIIVNSPLILPNTPLGGKKKKKDDVGVGSSI